MVSLLVIVLTFYMSKSFILVGIDTIFYGGIFLVIAGFLFSSLRSSNIKFGQTVIIGGVITMFLGYLF